MIFNDAKKQRALELHHEGIATRIIAKRLGVSYPTVLNWLRKNGLSPISICEGV